MSEHSSDVPESFPCHFLVYRIIPYPHWIAPDGLPTPEVFYRKRKDTDGASVSTTLQAGLDKMRRRVYRALSLHVGWVRDIGGLDVVRTPPNSRTHAAITGLPYSDTEDIAEIREVERLANRLLDIAREEPLPTSS